MELYNESNKTKSGEVSTARPVGALLITTTVKPDDIANEKISVYIERAQGSNTNICRKTPLLDFALASSFGTSALRVEGNDTDGYKTTMYCELAESGAIELRENERIKFELEGLVASRTYTVNAIEMPTLANDIVTFDLKQVLEGEQSRKFEVMGYEHAVFSNITAISEVHLTYVNGVTTKHTIEELRAIAFDVDPICVIQAGIIRNEVADRLVLPLIDVEAIDIYKNDASGVVDIVLRNENDDYNEDDLVD